MVAKSAPGPGIRLHARRALLHGGWRRDVRVELGACGRILAVETDARREVSDVDLGEGILLPAPANLHSHAFQRAMAGRTGIPKGDDDFWSWRTQMYGLVEALQPEHVESIASLAYVEMLEAGYASVGEFHYLHNAAGGRAYANPAEMTERILAAARQTGIGLTHLPVLYTQGDSSGAPLEGPQRRFACDFDAYVLLLGASTEGLRGLDADSGLGVAAHSLRTVPPEGIRFVSSALPTLPVHVHAAEQVGEVDEIERQFGRRPVEMLLELCDLDPHWCIVHATHMTSAETVSLATSGAVAGLCPITEADLGDGAFNGANYLGAGGRFGVGTDSNVRVSVADELRQFEYSQRLVLRRRNILGQDGQSCGRLLYRKACGGGAQALGRASGVIQAGFWADLVAIDGDHPALASLPDDQLLDGWLFAAGDCVVKEVWSAGRHVVRGGRHVARDAVDGAYRRTMRELASAIPEYS